jgi:phage tail tape-measure protein
MTVWRGGRGVKAPYESTHVRIPLPIKDRVEELSKAYKDGTLDELESKLLPLEEAIESARNILKQKKSARVSMENLLKVIYGEDVSL